MAAISYHICDNCGLEVSLYSCGERESMLKNHDGISKHDYLCSNCGNKATYYKENDRKCLKCNCDQLVGYNSETCPRCKIGKMITDTRDDAMF